MLEKHREETSGSRSEASSDSDGPRQHQEGAAGRDEAFKYGWELYFGVSAAADSTSATSHGTEAGGPGDPSDLGACNIPASAGNGDTPQTEQHGKTRGGTQSQDQDGESLASAPATRPWHRNSEAFARYKGQFLADGLLEAEADTLAAMHLESLSALHILGADLQLRILSALPTPVLLECGRVSREWRILARDDGLWRQRCAARGWTATAPGDSFAWYWQLSARRVLAWGCGQHAQLGLLDHAGRALSTAEPVEVSTLSRHAVLAVACGSAHSAAVLASGELCTWGCGAYGRLGHGGCADEQHPRVVAGCYPPSRPPALPPAPAPAPAPAPCA